MVIIDSRDIQVSINGALLSVADLSAKQLGQAHAVIERDGADDVLSAGIDAYGEPDSAAEYVACYAAAHRALSGHFLRVDF